MTDEVTDLVVLGAGSGGYAAALRAAQLGLSVTLIERDQVGGTCLHRGCVPTKALLHAAELVDAVRQGDEWGIRASISQIDAPVMVDRAYETVRRLHGGLSSLIRRAGIRQVSGHGNLVVDADGASVRVDNTTYRGRMTVLATGAVPRTVPQLPVDGERIITSDQALHLTTIPQSVAVIGGGVIGVEFASLWKSLGAQVHLFEIADRLLPEEDAQISDQFTRAFQRRGIDVRLGAGVRDLQRTGQTVQVTPASGDPFTVDVVLVAVGRVPNSDELTNVERLPSGHVRTDERLRTSVPGVVAIGDLVAGPQLAHRGFAHGIFAADELGYSLGLLPRPPIPPVDHELPRITYAQPQVASVGLTEEAARRLHGDVSVQVTELAGNARAQVVGTRGMVKLVRLDEGPVVGISAVGTGVGELMGEGQLIVGWAAHPEEVASLIHPHPTLGEVLGEAHLALAGRALHQL